jgi:site-specific DNA-methyltransferase (adenine-specific)
MMVIRLGELHRVLTPTGSISLHCDPTASHSVKLVLDAVLSPLSCRRECVWKRTTSHSDAKCWRPVAAVIFYDSTTDTVTWHPPYAPHEQESIADIYWYRDADGQLYECDTMTRPNPRSKMMDEWKGCPSCLKAGVTRGRPWQNAMLKGGSGTQATRRSGHA